MVIHKDLDSGTIIQILNDFFPGLVFIPKNSGDISVRRYFIQQNGKWTLDVHAMSKSKEKIYSSLFPENISRWNEAEARKKYDGSADIIRFFIDMENDTFSAEFTKSTGAALNGTGDNPTGSIPRRFFKKLNYAGKPVWVDWDFSALVIHKLRRRPPSIYEAFGYYARRFYTLMALGTPTPGSTAVRAAGDDELIKSGTRLLDNAVREQIPETAAWGPSPHRLTELFLKIQETLESVPSGGSLYVPAKLDLIISRLKTGISGLNKDPGYEEKEDTFSATDRKTINNHIEKARKFAADSNILQELNNVKLNGTYREKINMLHRIVFIRPLSERYSRRELDVIHGLFLKQHRPVSIDKAFGNGEDDNAFTGHDIYGDEKYTRAEDRFAWSSFFKKEFEPEMNKDALEKFIEYIPDHFSKFPFDVDDDGNLCMSKYSQKILFTCFCSSAGIPEDNELWGAFKIIIKRVIDSINNGRKD